MVDPLRRFEVVVLRPLQVVILLSAVLTLFNGMWWWLAGCIACLLYLGVVGSKLHPLQSAAALAQGPLEGPAAQIESAVLPVEVKQALLGHACTRTGILVGACVGVVSWAALALAWYWALAVAWFAMLVVGVVLKLAFRAV